MRLIEYLVISSSLHHTFQKIVIRAAPPKCAHYVTLHWKSLTRGSSSHPVGPLEEDFCGPGGMELGFWKYGTWIEEEEPWAGWVCIFPWPQQQSSKGSSSRALPFIMFHDSKIFRHSKHVSFYFLSSVITYFGKVPVGTWNPLIQISKTMNC